MGRKVRKAPDYTIMQICATDENWEAQFAIICFEFYRMIKLEPSSHVRILHHWLCFKELNTSRPRLVLTCPRLE